MHHTEHTANQSLEATVARSDALNAWLVANRIDPKATREYIATPRKGFNVLGVALVIVGAVVLAAVVLAQIVTGHMAQIVSGLGL